MGTVHRQDRAGSGVILYARTSKAHKRLSSMFRNREMQKTYWAVVKPAPPEQEGHVVNHLVKNEKRNKSFAHEHPAEGRKECDWMYEIRWKSEHYALVERCTNTGRHHYIRATMAHHGCTITVDLKYRDRRTNA